MPVPPLSFNISIPPEQRDRALAILDPKQVRRAVFNAVSRATGTGVAAIRKQVRAASTIDKDYLTDAVKSMKPKGDPPTGRITVSRKPIPAIAFNTLALKRGGVRVKYFKGRPAVRLDHAFIATMHNVNSDGAVSGHKGVFEREKGRDKFGKLTKGGYARRLHIKQVYGPTIAGLVEFPETFDQVAAAIQAALVKRFLSQIDRFSAINAAATADDDSTDSQ